MSLGISLFLIAVGAVLAFAVTGTANGIDLVAVGWILMCVGFLGIMMFLLFLGSFSPFYRGDSTSSHTREIVERPTSTTRTTEIVERPTEPHVH